MFLKLGNVIDYEQSKEVLESTLFLDDEVLLVVSKAWFYVVAVVVVVVDFSVADFSSILLKKTAKMSYLSFL